jgi:hypothetical protein
MFLILNNMDVFNFLKDCPSVNVTMRVEDLKEMVQFCILETRNHDNQRMIVVPDEFYTPKKTAEVLDCDITTLWRWRKNGYLSPISVGGKRKYKKSDIDKILEGAK